jgi:hypothetical protein
MSGNARLYVGDKSVEVDDPKWGHLWPVYSYRGHGAVAYFLTSEMAQVFVALYNERFATKENE